MKNEYEAKFPAVDVVGLRTKLADLGAVQTFPRTLLTRKIFECDVLDGARWMRLRDEQSVRKPSAFWDSTTAKPGSAAST